MPHPDTRQLINAWLKYHGIRPSSVSTTHGGGWLTVTDVLISQANQLLGASYQLYRNSKTSDTIIRTVSYALPAVLHKHIQTVAPTTYFTSKRVTRQTPRKRSLGGAPAQAQSESGNLVTAMASRAVEVWPEFLKWLYETETYEPLATAQNKLAVLGLQDQFMSQGDLNVFLEFFERVPTLEVTVVQINNGVTSEDDYAKEANTDIQYAAIMAYPTPLTFYSVGGDLAEDAFLRWFYKILDPRQPNIPQTIIISYGDYEENFSWEYADSVCYLFMHLGARGVSVLVASGSDGVGPDDCRDDQGNIKFLPEFPSSCTCGVLSPHSITGQGEVQATYQTAILQVPGSLPSAALQATPRELRDSPEAASPPDFRARCTRSMWWANTSRTSTVNTLTASSELTAAVTRPLFILYPVQLFGSWLP